MAEPWACWPEPRASASKPEASFAEPGACQPELRAWRLEPEARSSELWALPFRSGTGRFRQDIEITGLRAGRSDNKTTVERPECQLVARYYPSVRPRDAPLRLHAQSSRSARRTVQALARLMARNKALNLSLPVSLRRVTFPFSDEGWIPPRSSDSNRFQGGI